MTGPALTFSVAQIPFSRFGSWLNLSPVLAEGLLADDIHLITHQTGTNPILRLTPWLDDRRPETIWTATPAGLHWRHDAGRIEASFESVDTLRIRGRGLGLRLTAATSTLTPHGGIYCFTDPVDGSSVFTAYESGRRYRVSVVRGRARLAGGQALGRAERTVEVDSDGPGWEIAVEEFAGHRGPYWARQQFEAVRQEQADEFGAFLDDVAPWRSESTPAAELAAYVMWTSTVRPAGFVQRPAVLMSKHWMDKVWSWDHCFNAIALAGGRPGLALDQFLVPFDHQQADGALPDSVAHSGVLYNFVKPPIHGWALRQLRKRLTRQPDPPILADLYVKLSALARFWLDARRAPGRALPHYQHGNDSGWDNATTFDPGGVLITPDLAALLSGHVRELGRLAAELGHAAESRDWAATADQVQRDLLRQLWDGRRFSAMNPATGELSASRSLLDLMPITLGERLPADVAGTMVDGLGEHLTEWGLATEPVGSPHYREDGYWRGPIWAPSTVLIEDGVRRAGHRALADEISARFRRLCESSGFAENFGATTGDGLRDRAYSWTAAGYLILSADAAARSSL